MNKRKILTIVLSAFLVTNSISATVFANSTNVNKIEFVGNMVKKPIVEKAISKVGMTATATAFQPGEDASKVLDGNTSTMWHTPWSGSAVLPQSITINLGGSYTISSLKVTPRQSGDNGKIQDYEIYAGDTLVASGTWGTTTTPNVVRFDNEITTDNITIKATKAVGGFASIAEVDIYEKIGETSELISTNNVRVSNGQGVGANLNGEIDKVKNLESGTIIARFDLKSTGLQSIIGISNNNSGSDHFHLWTDGSQIGYEIRNASGNTNDKVNAKLNPGINTVAFKVEKDRGYSIYLNGELLKFTGASTTKFLNDIPNLNTIDIGKTDRSSGNEYLFTGDVDFLDIYGEAISDDYIIKKTIETKAQKLPLPEGTYKSDVKQLFKSGDLGAKKFRIPAMVTTKDGTIIAATDVRNDHWGDSPANIDAGVVISKDGGKTWTDQKRVIDYPGYASVIDSSMLQDEETGKVFLFITAFPENYGFPQIDRLGTGFETVDGEECMLLFDGEGREGQRGNGNKYYIKPGGKVYTSEGEETAYTVDTHNDLYENGVKIGNTFLPSSPLKAFGTAYLTIIESEDEGATWSAPKILPGIKKDFMKFIGACPGKGIQIKNGDKAGRLVFPLYYTNNSGFQSSAVMYSDDNGASWELGESPNDSRNDHSEDSDTITSGNQLTESQVVEMPDGQIKMFSRTTGNYVRISTSFDGGETWDGEVYEDTNLREPYCQLSVMNFSSLVDGKEAIIFSNPDASNRSNGTVKIGLIGENGTHENGRTKYTFDWKYKQTVKEGEFAYSCLTEMPNGNIGLFYEGEQCDSMDFTEMNVDFVKADLLADAPEALISEFTLLDGVDSYKAGEKFTLKVSFDQAVSLIGDRSFTALVDGKEVPLTLAENNTKNIVLEGIIPEDITEGNHTITIKGKNNLDVINVTGKLTDISSDINTNLAINVKSEVSEDVVVEKIRGLEATSESNSVLLNWNSPESTVGLEEYVVYKDGKEFAVIPADITELNITGLRSNTIYGFKVGARFSNGEESKPVSLNVRTTK
ncbi:sialidase domain-containing protein [Clostridium sp.]|uniref:sialidase domain-containing protein n=1 Tax=Clostridium sp. TaxID=1506 RepID=UPI003F312491